MAARDPRLDRLVEFDPRSRQYSIREVVGDEAPRSYTWPCGIVLDQGPDGACVGFSISHEIAARPSVSVVDYDFAYGIYRRAQFLDEFPGEDYDGTSVLGGVKAAKEKGYYGTYRWAFGLDDLVLAVGHHGPAVLGINWYESMFDPDSRGFVRVAGDVAGGHAILCRGVNVTSRYVTLHNSWGPEWGRSGTCRVSFDDIERLLHEEGEAMIPEQRFKVAA